MCDLYVFEKTKKTELGLVSREIKVGISENAETRVNQFRNAADVYSGKLLRVIRFSSRDTAFDAEQETLRYFDAYRELRENGSKSEVLSAPSLDEHAHLLWAVIHHVTTYKIPLVAQAPVTETPVVRTREEPQRYKEAARAAMAGEGIIFCKDVSLPNSFGRNDCLKGKPLDINNKENMHLWLQELKYIKRESKGKYTYKTGNPMTDPTLGNGNLSAYIHLFL